MSELILKAKNVSNKQDFIEFIQLLLSDLDTNIQEWENPTLQSYLEAIESWTEDMEGYYSNNKVSMPEKIEWRIFADILMAARIYE